MKHALLSDSPRSPGPRRWPRTALGYGLALVCLYWVLRDLDPGELLRRVASMNLLLLAVAILFNALSYLFQGLRWKLLLRPVGTVTVLRTTQAIAVAAQTCRGGRSVWSWDTGGIRHCYPPRGNSTQENSFTALVRSIGFELQLASKTGGALLAFMLSLLLLFLQGLSFWFVMRAYGLHLTFAMGLAVFIIVHLGTLVPGAPANVGSYQFFTVLGLTLFGVEKATAAGFSFVVFTVLTAPLWAIGLWALGSSGLSFGEIRSELANLLTPAKLREIYQQQERP